MMIPAVTVYQPWATLIVYGFKPWEFRGWPATRAYWNRRIAIHAGARPVKRPEVAELIVKLRDSDLAPATGLINIEGAIALLERVHTSPGMLPLSSVLCLATLGEPVRGAEMAARIGWRPALVNDSDGGASAIATNWGWPLTDVAPLMPYVPQSGMQRIWRWLVPDTMECRRCGCTNDNCAGCIARTGEACHWIEADLCSACAPVTAELVT
jgi:hypothetical protein